MNCDKKLDVFSSLFFLFFLLFFILMLSWVGKLQIHFGGVTFLPFHLHIHAMFTLYILYYICYVYIIFLKIVVKVKVLQLPHVL